MKCLLGAVEKGFYVSSAHACVDRAPQASLTLLEVSTAAKLIGPVEASGLSEANRSPAEALALI